MAIPGNLRAALEKNSAAKEIVVGRHPRHPCLMARDLAADAELHAKMQERRETAEDLGREFDGEAMRRISSVEAAPFDSATADIREQVDHARLLGVSWLINTGTAKPEHYEAWYRQMNYAASYAADTGIQIVTKPHGGVGLERCAREHAGARRQLDHRVDVGLDQTEQGPGERRLAAARLADEAERFAAHNLQVDAGQCLQLGPGVPVGRRQPAHRDDGVVVRFGGRRQ